jgi:hypothetical protein
MGPRIAFGAGVLLMLFEACLALPWLPSGSISGHIYERDSGRPLAAAQILILEAGIDVRSDSDGAFRIDLLSPGTYAVKVILKGYMSVQARVVVGEYGRANVEFRMLKARDALEARRAERPAETPRSLSGRVHAGLGHSLRTTT